MGNWHHPKHYTDAAKAYAVAVRTAEIAIFLDQAMPAIRSAARDMGYAITIHGSLARDLDAVAVPWVDDAEEPLALVLALAKTIKECTGWGHIPGGIDSANFTPKPHGRVAITIVASAEIHFDLSIMPRLAA